MLEKFDIIAAGAVSHHRLPPLAIEPVVEVRMPVLIDITGQRFGRLTVVRRVDRVGSRGWWRWLCRCDCGGDFITTGATLRQGYTRSCGCIRRERNNNWQHGGCGTRLYEIWSGIKKRCLNPKNRNFRLYGGRGIIVCDEWKTFEGFREWAMVNGYADDLSIERINNDGNYEPGNCTWATPIEQGRNTRRNRPVMRSDNRQFATIAEAVEALPGSNSSGIVAVCRGHLMTHRGFGWSYL
jgi:hypothetical protein